MQLAHVFAQSPDELLSIQAILAPHLETCSVPLFGHHSICSGAVELAVVSIDLRDVRAVGAFRAMAARVARAALRIFLVPERDHRLEVQANALGATQVLTWPAELPKLLDIVSAANRGGSNPASVRAAAGLGAARLSNLFLSAANNGPVETESVLETVPVVVEAVRQEGLRSWLSMVRSHHEGTYQHCLLVVGVAVDFALLLGFGEQDVKRLCSAAMLHDVGKAIIPEAILDKPGKLDAVEREIIESHPQVGYKLLRETGKVTDEVLDAVRHHHEFLDGSGYPDKLMGASISDPVRLLTISDIFGALVERRSYRAPMPRDKAYDILANGMSGKLEKALVRQFRHVALVR